MLKERDIFILAQGHSFYAKLPQALVYDNEEMDFSLVRGEMHMRGVVRGLDTSIFEGEWVVTKIASDGGSDPDTPMGSPNYGYPDGHHVWARKIYRNFAGKRKLSTFEINFYQSGAFTCMNEDITACGTWEKSLKPVSD